MAFQTRVYIFSAKFLHFVVVPHFQQNCRENPTFFVESDRTEELKFERLLLQLCVDEQIN